MLLSGERTQQVLRSAQDDNSVLMPILIFMHSGAAQPHDICAQDDKLWVAAPIFMAEADFWLGLTLERLKPNLS